MKKRKTGLKVKKTKLYNKNKNYELHTCYMSI
jgi:hypothetical protein